jgi:hypothetical protein
MSDPLPPNIHWCPHVQLDLTHLEGSRVHVPHQITDESAVIADAFRAGAIRHPSRLNDSGITSHVIYDPYKAVIKDFEFVA